MNSKKHKILNKNFLKNAFTLLELIVVITILAILGTIAFISLQGYSKSARDSRRITDAQNIKKAIEVYQIQSSRYPEPSYFTGITYLGEEIRKQGTVGDSVITNVSKTLSKIPLDPLTNNEYTYSVLNTWLEYELGLISETNRELSINALSSTYAGDKIAYITGNYNGQVATVKVGSIDYILTVPSIINGDIGITDYIEIIEQKTIVYDGYNNVPYSYNDELGGFDYTPGKIVVFSGSLDDLEVNEILRVHFLESLKEAYDGTIIENDNAGIEEVVEVELDTNNPTTEARKLAIDILVARVNLNIGEEQYPEPNPCEIDGVIISHGETITAYQYEEISWDAIETCEGTKINRTCSQGILSGEDIYYNLTCFKGEPLNCETTVQEGYNIEYLNHAGTGSISKIVEVANGDITYTATAQCNNGVITIYGETDNLSCDLTYHIEYSEVEESYVCVSDTRNCDTIANGTGEQYWSGTNWSECTLISCNTDYHEDSENENTCISNSKTVTCGGIIASNATASTATTYTQTWNGTMRLPTTFWGESQATCDFDCNTTYSWNTSIEECVSTIISCNVSNGSGTKTFNETTGEYDECVVEQCDTDYYKTSTSICSPVGVGYYSSSTSINRIACTNHPDTASRNYTYTSDGNGTNSCNATYTELCGIDKYETSNGICSNVGNGYYSPASENSRIACTNHPDTASRNYTYTSDGNGTNSCSATYTELCGVDKYETSNGICSNVGNGYYSPASENSRIACTNHPDTASRNYTYTSDGNGTNSCSATYTELCGIDKYETSNGICSNVGNGYYSPASENSRIACTNHPDTASRNYTYTSDGNGTNSCSATYTELCGVDKYETSNGICSNVGNGYYSPASENSRIACTNHPDTASRNYTYTSDGNGTNSCSATYTELCGIDKYETSNGICSNVGNGYYSPASENSRIACTNHPDTASRNYTYTSDGNGTNSCSATYTAKCGIDYYEYTNGTCKVVGVGYYSPSLNNTRYSCTNKPANSNYTSDGNGTNSCSWSCQTGYIQSGNSCVLQGNREQLGYTCSDKYYKLVSGSWVLSYYDDCPIGTSQGDVCNSINSKCVVYQCRACNDCNIWDNSYILYMCE